MGQHTTTVEEFEALRSRLSSVALRLVGSVPEAEDVVQDAWLRLTRADRETVDNLAGWLTTVVSRLAIDRLRARARTAGVVDGDAVGPPAIATDDPEADVVLADAVSSALLLVLDTLGPAERVAFVLHDSFNIPFEQIGQILGRSASAAKQLASRARHKVRGRESVSEADPGRRRAVVDAFLAASRAGDFDALLALLDPAATMTADAAAVGMGSPEVVRGAAGIASTFSGRAQGARALTVDGARSLAWIVGGRPKVVWDLVIEGGRITHIDMLAAAETIETMDIDSGPDRHDP